MAVPPRIDLIWLGDAPPPEWNAGACHAVPFTTAALADHMAQAATSAADGWLFWHESAGLPDAARALAVWERPGQVWHAGLALGTAGQPALLDHFSPLWMFNRDGSPAQAITSWRLTLRAALFRVDVLRALGGVLRRFESPDAAALELGHRYLRQGALLRHTPALLSAPPNPPPIQPVALVDQVRFIHERAGRRWAGWCALCAVAAGDGSLPSVWSALGTALREPTTPDPAPYHPPPRRADEQWRSLTVGVLIPTVDRYPYLRAVLDALRRQTNPPTTVVIVDQTPPERRDDALLRDYADLPLRLLTLEPPGQCRSRNLGLRQMTDDCILFLDDDITLPDDLIEQRLRVLSEYGADAVSGTVYQPGQTPEMMRADRISASDGFPTSCTLIRRSALRASGLFDLAYDQRSRADGDLGMRVYLSGAVLLTDERAPIQHHHAPRGGLRTHGARVITLATSRRSTLIRHLIGVSDLYLGGRYFNARQVDAACWLSALATLTRRGTRMQRALRLVIQACLLPHTIWRIRQNRRAAAALFARYPIIPPLDDET